MTPIFNRLSTVSLPQERHDPLSLAQAPHWGIALSGGVDSMALATLLSQHVRQQQHRIPSMPIRLHAMIVNHNLRDNSKEEAEYVASLVQHLGIEPHVLHLDWTAGIESACQNAKPDKAHLETLARTKRYDAIAHQCAKLSIRHLFVGHHAGDQVETVLFRLARASGIDGLAGIQSISPMGVIHTAQAKSIQVIRPLLSATKDRLEATCREVGTRWVEDPTNRSLDYQRNIIRHYQKDVDRLVEQQPSLAPLTTSNLMAFRERMDRHRRIAYAQVSQWMSRIEFDKENGLCFFQLQESTTQDPSASTLVPWLSPSQEHIGTRLLAQLVRWVTCKDHVPRSDDVQGLLQKMRQAEKTMASVSEAGEPARQVKAHSEVDTDNQPEPESTVYRRLKPRHRKGAHGHGLESQPPQSSINHAGVLLLTVRSARNSAKAGPYWILSRQPYSVAEQLAATVDVPLTLESKKDPIEILWNNRFFVGMQRLSWEGTEETSPLQIRLLQPKDVATLRDKKKKMAKTTGQARTGLGATEAALLEGYLSKVPNKARYLIPVIVDQSQQVIVSIPSLGIHLQPHRFKIESQYRYIPPKPLA
ncbi:DnaJ sub C member 10 [Actinomortierella ambigua]|nr:DnaJ sub C member 10 [Actinomortierella ambigua]